MAANDVTGTRRIKKLDSVRGIAALMVLVGHCGGLPLFVDVNGSYFWWLKSLWDGETSVIMFFVLSGYVLALQQSSPARPDYSGFVVRRFARIWPAFAVALASAFALLHLCGVPSGASGEHGGYHPVPGDLGLNLLMLGSPYTIDPPVWSLYVEMHISLIFPLLYVLANRVNLPVGLVVSMAASLLLTRTVHWAMPEFLVSLASSSRYLCLFVVGASLARGDSRIGQIYRAAPDWAKAAGLAFAALCIAYRNAPVALPVNGYVPWVGVVLLFVYCLYAQSAERFLNAQPLLFLGRISYGLYLVHYPILQAVKAHLAWPATVFVVLALAVLFGWLINILVEEPMIRVGKRLTARRTPMPTPDEFSREQA